MIKKTIGHQIAETLEEWIFQEVFKPGEQIKESHLAKKMGVSQSPVREALRILEERGFVVHTPHSGNLVVQLSDTDILNIHEVRMLLEPYALQLARKHASEIDLKELDGLLGDLGRYAEKNQLLDYHRVHTLFHLKIWETSRNQALVDSLNKITGPLWATYRQRVRGTQGKLGGMKTHLPLFEYISGKIESNPHEIMLKHNTMH